jgi:hypothetical protein
MTTLNNDSQVKINAITPSYVLLVAVVSVHEGRNMHKSFRLHDTHSLTAAARSKRLTVFYKWNSVIVGSDLI